nr:hypothetical protein [Nonomuraea mesophila]
MPYLAFDVEIRQVIRSTDAIESVEARTASWCGPGAIFRTKPRP